MPIPLPLTPKQLRSQQRATVYVSGALGLGLAYVQQSVLIAVLVIGFAGVAYIAQSIQFAIERLSEEKAEAQRRSALKGC